MRTVQQWLFSRFHQCFITCVLPGAPKQNSSKIVRRDGASRLPHHACHKWHFTCEEASRKQRTASASFDTLKVWNHVDATEREGKKNGRGKGDISNAPISVRNGAQLGWLADWCCLVEQPSLRAGAKPRKAKPRLCGWAVVEDGPVC